MDEKHRLMNLPLKQLIVFEAVAHSQTFAQAADSLCMTQSGVSQHIQELEAYLGTRLINRRPKDGILTEDGKYLCRIVTRNLKGVYDAVSYLRTRRGSLKVRSSRSFATKWLMPRLDAFVQRHPGVDAHFGLFTRDVLDPQTLDVDVVIIYGDGRWEGYDATPLVHEYLAPLCRPEVCPRTLADLGSSLLLHPTEDRHEWKLWADRFQVALDIHSGLTFETMYLALEAAAEGAGVAIGDLNLVGGELEAGTLVLPFPKVYKSPNQYFLLTHPGRENPLAERFRAWILDELARNRPRVEVWEAWTAAP